MQVRGGGKRQMHQHPQGMEIIYICIIGKVKRVSVSNEITTVCLNKIHSCRKIDCLTTGVVFSERRKNNHFPTLLNLTFFSSNQCVHRSFVPEFKTQLYDVFSIRRGVFCKKT